MRKFIITRRFPSLSSGFQELTDQQIIVEADTALEALKGNPNGAADRSIIRVELKEGT